MATRIPSLCFHRGTGRFYVTLGGREIYLGETKRHARREYDRLVGEWMANGRRLPASLAGPGNLTVGELINQYRGFAESYYVDAGGRPTGHTERSVKPACRMLRLLYGKQAARDFGPLALQALRERMIGEGLARGVINQRVGTIKRMFRWAVGQQLLEPAVFQALDAVPGLRAGRGGRETAPVQPVADSVVECTLPHLPGVVADMVRVQRLTGMRPQEVCALRPVDLDRTGDVWVFRPVRHKTQHHGRERVVFIGPKAQAILRPYLLREAGAFCFVPAESEAKRRAEVHAQRVTPMSCGNKPGKRRRKRERAPGDQYNPNTYRRAIHRACDKADEQAKAEAARRGEPVADNVRLVERWSPNRLRHTAATEIRRQFGLEAAQVALGHAQANVTQVYAERDMAKGVEVARLVG